jgi:alpha/beta superfamily hydrolase
MNVPHDSRTFFLDGPAGRLEAILWTPAAVPESAAQQTFRAPQAPRFSVVVCHPHPLFGGTMHNKVVYQATKSLAGLGMPVLRFNFRGTGLSEGAHDRGRGEVEDVRAAFDFLAGEFPVSQLLLAGFSFGSWVGLRAGCADARVARLIGLGIPVNNCDFSFLADCAKPKLFVHGENDEHGAIAKVREVVAGLSGDNSLVVVPNADHFFAGKLNQLDHAITHWLTPARGLPV